MKRSFTVFLCSTYDDLVDERARVLDAVTRLQMQHDSMEFFGARSGMPIETCLAEVGRSDVIVVVIGHRYGSLVHDLGLSFSEAEYREGQRLGKPCLVYIRDENAPVLPRNFERDPEKLRLLEKWKQSLTTKHTVAKFSDAQTLAVQVVADLSRTIQALIEAESDTTTTMTHNSMPSPLSEVERLVSRAMQRGLSSRDVVSTVRRALFALLESSGSRKPVVFFSYSHADRAVVRQVADRLHGNEVDVWIDAYELDVGDSILESVQRALAEADFVAFFLSKESIIRPSVRIELDIVISRRIAENQGPIVLPILLDDAEVPSILRDVMYLDMRDGDVQAGAEKLASAIRYQHLERLHTFRTSTNRYFNPPQELPRIGRQLQSGSFADLVSQLRDGEALFGLYRNQVDALVATHVHSRARMDELGRLGDAEGYFALDIERANEGLGEKIPLGGRSA